MTLDSFTNAKILCIGDVMLDRFIYGSVDRISPEAPIPVFSIKREEHMPGGAGNVVRNTLALGAHTSFISVVGDDKVAYELTTMMGKELGLVPYMLMEKDRITTQKTRYIAANQQMLRADMETREPIRENTQEQLLDIVAEEIPQHDVIILSDYGKGVLCPGVIHGIMRLAKAHNKKVVVDPKGRDFSIYRGAYIITPNLGELTLATGIEPVSEAEIIRAGQKIIHECDIANILVTRSKDGMTLITTDGAVTHIPAHARDVFDVSGAGDTAVATLATGIAAGQELAQAARLANVAAGIVVGKIGTAVVHRSDLKTTLHAQESSATGQKILPLELAGEQAESWRRDGKKIGFTNGCFDLVHPGHLALLYKAKSRCDRLIVGLNSDASVKRLKGPTRPVNNDIERATLLAALAVVDMVVIFEEDTPLHVLETLKPDVLCKGADYTKEQVVGAQLVESYGGTVELIPLEEGYSTTQILSRIG